MPAKCNKAAKLTMPAKALVCNREKDYMTENETRPRRDLPHGRRKKRKKKISGLPIIISLLVVLMTVIFGGCFFYINGNRLMLPGEWVREIDITDRVISAAEEYLQTAAYGDEIDTSAYFADIKVTSILTVTKDGSLAEVIDTESYNQAQDKCKSGLEAAVKDLIAKRIENTYIETNKSVDELVNETFKISLSEYLNQYGPVLMPDISEMESAYGRNASYEASREQIVITYADADVHSCNYAIAHGMLVVDYNDGAVVYHER